MNEQQSASASDFFLVGIMSSLFQFKFAVYHDDPATKVNLIASYALINLAMFIKYPYVAAGTLCNLLFAVSLIRTQNGVGMSL